MYYPVGGPLGSDSSWGMFVLTGNPAYYMLYRGIAGYPQEGLTEEEKQRR